MKRGLLSDISSLVSALLCEESVLLLGACHAARNFNFDVNFNILRLILIFHDGQSPWERFSLSVARAEAVFKVRIASPRCIRTIDIVVFGDQAHHCLRP